jgi:hypothetical protein
MTQSHTSSSSDDPSPPTPPSSSSSSSSCSASAKACCRSGISPSAATDRERPPAPTIGAELYRRSGFGIGAGAGGGATPLPAATADRKLWVSRQLSRR